MRASRPSTTCSIAGSRCRDSRISWIARLTLTALEDNIVFFHSPSDIAAKKVPLDRRLRVGGLVKKGTWKKAADGLTHRFLITDLNAPPARSQTQAGIPVIIERPDWYEGGSNVLFMDGHVEFIKYPGPFPMTEAFIEELRSLDALKP